MFGKQTVTKSTFRTRGTSCKDLSVFLSLRRRRLVSSRYCLLPQRNFCLECEVHVRKERVCLAHGLVGHLQEQPPSYGALGNAPHDGKQKLSCIYERQELSQRCRRRSLTRVGRFRNHEKNLARAFKLLAFWDSQILHQARTAKETEERAKVRSKRGQERQMF